MDMIEQWLFSINPETLKKCKKLGFLKLGCPYLQQGFPGLRMVTFKSDIELTPESFQFLFLTNTKGEFFGMGVAFNTRIFPKGLVNMFRL